MVMVSLGGCPEFVDFAFGECGILVVDHPEVKLFEDGDEVADGVLFEWPLTAGSLHFSVQGLQRRDPRWCCLQMAR